MISDDYVIKSNIAEGHVAKCSSAYHPGLNVDIRNSKTSKYAVVAAAVALKRSRVEVCDVCSTFFV